VENKTKLVNSTRLLPFSFPPFLSALVTVNECKEALEKMGGAGWRHQKRPWKTWKENALAEWRFCEIKAEKMHLPQFSKGSQTTWRKAK